MNFTQSFCFQLNIRINMDKHGFIRAAAAVPIIKTADTKSNAEEICRLTGQAIAEGASLVVFPELCITGCSCGDLFSQKLLLDSAEEAVKSIIDYSCSQEIIIVISSPVRIKSEPHSCTIIISKGEILGLIPDSEYTDSESIDFAGRKITPSSTGVISIGKDGMTLGICTGDNLPQAQIIAHPAASYEIIGRHKSRREYVQEQSLMGNCGYIYASAGYGESTQDVVYSGASLIAVCGTIIADGDRFAMESTLTLADIDLSKLCVASEDAGTKPAGNCGNDAPALSNGSSLNFQRTEPSVIDPHPFIPDDEEMDEACNDALSIQTMGLVRRLEHIGAKSAVIGISGGLDSTLALLVTVLAADRLGWPRKNVIGVTMPGYGTSGRTYNNALEMMRKLGITMREISIAAACDQHFKDIGHDKAVHDTTFENSQARERTQILMDVANQCGGIVIGTGDLSELALGWATYNGDHMSMYGVNASIPKTLVRYLVKWAAENRFADIKDVLIDVVETPVSPELLPADEKGEIQQVTEDLVGPYELHDFFLYEFYRYGNSPSEILARAEQAFRGSYDRETIRKWLKKFIWRFFSQQFKRSCLPDGPQVTEVSLSPRGGWRMPSDSICRLWIDDIDKE